MTKNFTKKFLTKNPNSIGPKNRLICGNENLMWMFHKVLSTSQSLLMLINIKINWPTLDHPCDHRFHPCKQCSSTPHRKIRNQNPWAVFRESQTQNDVSWTFPFLALLDLAQYQQFFYLNFDKLNTDFQNIIVKNSTISWIEESKSENCETKQTCLLIALCER